MYSLREAAHCVSSCYKMHDSNTISFSRMCSSSMVESISGKSCLLEDMHRNIWWGQCNLNRQRIQSCNVKMMKAPYLYAHKQKACLYIWCSLRSHDRL